MLQYTRNVKDKNMEKTLWKYITMKKKEAKEKGKRFTKSDLCEQLGIGKTYLYTLLSGQKIVSYIMADNIERTTNGEILANDLLEESIGWHRKWLERKKRFGEDPSKTA